MVLLVDDQLVIGEAVRRALVDQPDLEFHFCSDSDNAVETAKRVLFQPTVILQDLVMPGTNELDYLGQPLSSSTHRPAKGIPIIVLSTKEKKAIVKSEAFTCRRERLSREASGHDRARRPDPLPFERLSRAQVQRDEAYRALRRTHSRS